MSLLATLGVSAAWVVAVWNECLAGLVFQAFDFERMSSISASMSSSRLFW